MLITKPAIAALMTGFNTLFRKGYKDSPVYSGRFTTTIPSSARVETYGWMTRLPKMREWLGARVFNNLKTEVYTLVNKTFEDTVAIDVDDIADDTLGVYNPIMEEFGRVSMKLQDQEMKTAIQAGTSALSFDGVAYFASTHPIDPAGNQSNNFTSSALSATNFDTVRSAMTSYTGDDGEPLAVMPKLLVVPPQLEKEALEIVAAERNSSGATNVLRGAAEVLVVPELANEPTTWYLMDVSRAIKPFVWQNRQSPAITQMDSPTDEGVFMENRLRIGVKARGAAGYGLWFLCARAIA